MDASPGFFRRGTGLFTLWPVLFVLWPVLFVLEGLAAQDHRWSVMVDLAHLELFHGVGRGGHRHDDSPVIAGVIGVNVLQLLHKIRQHGGHPDAPLVSSLYASLDKVDQSRQMNLSVPGEQIKRISLKKVRKWAIIPQISAMVRTLIASRSRSIAD